MADYLPGWTKRVQFSIANTNIDSDQTHFPVSLTLGTAVGVGDAFDNSFIFDELASDANRLKIACTLVDGTSEIYVEIESWDDAGETANLWVSKSDFVVSSSVPTLLWLYFEAAHADNTTFVGDVGSAPGEAVWDSSHCLVMHMSETGSNPTLVDSTSNDNDSNANTSDPTTSGQINGAADFTVANSDYATIAQTNDFFTASMTIEQWINIGANSDNQQTVGGKSTGSEIVFIQNIDASDIMRLLVRDSSNTTVLVDGSTNVQGGWHHVVATLNAATDEMDMYVDGASDASTVDSSTLDDSYVIDTDIVIGAGASAHNFDHVNGVLDEIRISTSARSAAWIKAGFYSGDDNLVSWGGERDLQTAAVDIEPGVDVAAIGGSVFQGALAITPGMDLAALGTYLAQGSVAIGLETTLSMLGGYLVDAAAAITMGVDLAAIGQIVIFASCQIEPETTLSITGNSLLSGASAIAFAADIVALANYFTNATVAITPEATLAVTGNYLASAIVAISAAVSLAAIPIKIIQGGAVSITIEAGLVATAVKTILVALGLDGDLAAGSVWEINSEEQTFKIDGVNVLKDMVGDFFNIPPGESVIEYDDDEVTRDVDVEIELDPRDA